MSVSQKGQTDAPFGTLPRRSPGPLRTLIVVLGVWIAFLIWMAAAQVAS